MWKRILLVAGIGSLLAVLYANGLLGEHGLSTLKAWFTESGFFGPLLFVVLFATTAGVGAPSFPYLLAAVAVWPLWQALALNWAGGVGAGIVGFGFARYVGRGWVEAHMPARFRGLDARVGERGLATVIFVRLMFFMAPPAHWALGLTRVGFGTFVAGTLIGLLPWMILWTLVSDPVVAWLAEQPPIVWVGILVGFGAVAVLVHRLVGRRVSAE